MYSDEYTDIPQRAKHPFREYTWEKQELARSLRSIEEEAARFRIELEARPIDEGEIKVTALHPRATPSGRQASGVVSLTTVPFEYRLDAGGPVVVMHFAALASELRGKGVKGTWDVQIEIEYPVAPESSP
jgi:hypothetical protein